MARLTKRPFCGQTCIRSLIRRSDRSKMKLCGALPRPDLHIELMKLQSYWEKCGSGTGDGPTSVISPAAVWSITLKPYKRVLGNDQRAPSNFRAESGRENGDQIVCNRLLPPSPGIGNAVHSGLFDRFPQPCETLILLFSAPVSQMPYLQGHTHANTRGASLMNTTSLPQLRVIDEMRVTQTCPGSCPW